MTYMDCTTLKANLEKEIIKEMEEELNA